MRAFLVLFCLAATPVLAQVSVPFEGSTTYTIRSGGVAVLGVAFSLRQSDARIAVCGAVWLEVDTKANAELAQEFLERTNVTVETQGQEFDELLLLRTDTTRFPIYGNRNAVIAGGLPCIETDYKWDPKFESVKIDILTEPDPAE